VLATTFYGISERPPVGTRRFGLTVQPQPCRAEAFVRFELPRPGQVSLALYDAAGRQVRQFIAGCVNAGGQVVRLSVSGLPAGGYVCRLVADGCVETTALVLAR
jgi:hypothetical protein